MRRILAIVVFVSCAIALGAVLNHKVSEYNQQQVVVWSEKEKQVLTNMQLNGGPDGLLRNGFLHSQGNRWAEVELAARFGHRLFFDKRLSRTGDVACSNCHDPNKYFTDGKALPVAAGQVGTRNTPTVVGAAMSPWQFWDGRSDSLWSQALIPLESPNEQGNNRTNIAHLVNEHHRAEYESVFGPLPDLNFDNLLRHGSPNSEDPSERENWAKKSAAERRAVNTIFTNLGKAIAAYERKLMPAPGRFDDYVQAVVDNNIERQNALFNRTEQYGLKLFISEDGGRCVNCHNGPLLTNFDFQAIAVPPVPEQGGDLGRILTAPYIGDREFGCTSQYSDAEVERGDCAESQYAKTYGIELIGAFKVPSLRNISKTAPYMHKGQLKDLSHVLHYYNRAPQEMAAHSEIQPLKLFPAELQSIEAFLKTLDSDIAADQTWLVPPTLDSVNAYVATVSWMSRHN